MGLECTAFQALPTTWEATLHHFCTPPTTPCHEPSLQSCRQAVFACGSDGPAVYAALKGLKVLSPSGPGADALARDAAALYRAVPPSALRYLDLGQAVTPDAYLVQGLWKVPAQPLDRTQGERVLWGVQVVMGGVWSRPAFTLGRPSRCNPSSQSVQPESMHGPQLAQASRPHGPPSCACERPSSPSSAAAPQGPGGSGGPRQWLPSCPA